MDKDRLKMIDLFTGIGGFTKAFESVFDTIGYCDTSEYCRSIIISNIQSGLLRAAPVCDDVRTIHRQSFHGEIPCVITGGFPCQDISSTNVKGPGLKGARSGLFHEIIRIVHVFPEVKHVILENVPRLLIKGFDVVQSELEGTGFEIATTWGTSQSKKVIHSSI